MDITETVYAADRTEWRAWLSQNHAAAKEIWLVSYARSTNRPSVSYLHAVEEALCFGWIDGIAKKMDTERTAQRFTPRRPKGNWTELNKERARRLIAAGLMTDAGRAVLPDLTLRPLEIAPDILEALQADPQTWENFQSFPDLYQRIRIGVIEEQRRNPAVFLQRLNSLLQKTAQNKMFRILE
ncbi:MAG TPA: YdeI/OmpD-associated family protein [Candidatus Limnocylindrales bacterium]|nr:YdeI/OmpD-associated family protein [Candidatus Limnocylindrales bacterium]